jgi:hypothetical protein
MPRHESGTGAAIPGQLLYPGITDTERKDQWSAGVDSP